MLESKPDEEKTLESVRRKFEKWRRTRAKKGIIPEKLWDEAVALSGKYSIAKIANQLKLNHTALKERMERNQAAGQVQMPNPNTFMEVGLEEPEVQFHKAVPCLIELQTLGGASLKIYSADGNHIDLLSLINVFWKRMA